MVVADVSGCFTHQSWCNVHSPLVSIGVHWSKEPPKNPKNRVDAAGGMMVIENFHGPGGPMTGPTHLGVSVPQRCCDWEAFIWYWWRLLQSQIGKVCENERTGVTRTNSEPEMMKSLGSQHILTTYWHILQWTAALQGQVFDRPCLEWMPRDQGPSGSVLSFWLTGGPMSGGEAWLSTGTRQPVAYVWKKSSNTQLLLGEKSKLSRFSWSLSWASNLDGEQTETLARLFHIEVSPQWRPQGIPSSGGWCGSARGGGLQIFALPRDCWMILTGLARWSREGRTWSLGFTKKRYRNMTCVYLYCFLWPQWNQSERGGGSRDAVSTGDLGGSARHSFCIWSVSQLKTSAFLWAFQLW